MILGDVGVDLRRRKVGMAQHGLHRAEIRAAPQQVGRERMAQLVRRGEGHDPDARRVAADHPPEAFAREATRATRREEEDLLIGRSLPGPHLAEVARSMIQRDLADRNESRLAALPPSADEAALQIEVTEA